MMAEYFDQILDECIDRINRGDSLVDCLSDYPAYSEKLKPLLQSMYDVQKAYDFAPSADTKRAARQKLQAALVKQQQTTPALSFFRVISRPAVWVTVAVFILAIVGTLVIQSVLNPPVLVPSADGNFAFLVSDDPGDIYDFKNLNITISEVQLQPVRSKVWLKLTPEIDTVDISQLRGEQYQEIWRGHVPAGKYTHVRIYVSEVKGELESTGQTIDMNVPGGIVYMLIPFEVTFDTITMYICDITVVGPNDDGTYILKLEINESGAWQEPKLLE